MKSCYNNLLFKVIDGAFSVMFLKDSAFKKSVKELPKTPKDFKPVLRFAVCSDVHVSGEEIDKGAENFGAFLDDMNELKSKGYDGIDAIMVAGDMTNRGLDKQYEKFVSVLNEHKKEKTKLLICIGNHEFIEYRDYKPVIGHEKYQKYISEILDTHEVVNGYHFIGLSYSADAKTFNGKAEWLDSEITKAEKADPTKPIFVFQHPAPVATIYGSINWADNLVKKVLKKHKSVIDFSGHSHYVPSDPRSAYQGKFTAFGTGSLEGLLGNPGYVMTDEHSLFDSAAGLVVEADKDGNVRVRCYDVLAHMFYEQGDRYLPNVTKKNSFVYYWKTMKKLDTKPKFESNDIGFYENEDGTVSVGFGGAEGYFKPEGYTVKVKDTDGKTILDKTVLSEYTRADWFMINLNLGNIKNGKYKVKVVARSPYGKLSKAMKKTIDY
ncbi:MAG: metallophosphoesterase [Clostridia bacterium]|nr:metallophosphoesterase [Clostridia bacterium]